MVAQEYFTMNNQTWVDHFKNMLFPKERDIYICDRACNNRACGHMIFAYFFTFSSLIMFCTIMLWH